MGSRPRLAAAAAALSMAFAGCEGSADPEDQAAESAEATESAEGSTAAAEPEPGPGTCWTVPAASAVDPRYWYDDSSQVPCTEPHTTETAQVLNLTEPTIAEAKELGLDLCWEYARTYIGIDPASWVPWGYAVFLPSKQEIANGASWIRCDAVFPETWDFGSVRTTTVAAQGLADDPPADFWACFDEPPTKAEQPFVPCDQPHAYEQTGTLAILDDLAQYPTAAALATETRRQCRQGVPAERPDVSVTAAWDPRANFERNTSVAGACFIFRADGQPLPAR